MSLFSEQHRLLFTVFYCVLHMQSQKRFLDIFHPAVILLSGVKTFMVVRLFHFFVIDRFTELICGLPQKNFSSITLVFIVQTSLMLFICNVLLYFPSKSTISAANKLTRWPLLLAIVLINFPNLEPQLFNHPSSQVTFIYIAHLQTAASASQVNTGPKA